jgi:hypothetical protein
MAAANDGNSGQLWQFSPVNGSSNTYQIRNIMTTNVKQLGTCYNANEVSDSKTQPCMVSTSSDPSQLWNVTLWDGESTWRFVNIGNGSAYNMDCHPGNPMFMSDITVATPVQPAQHWEFSSVQEVNSNLYSTIFVRTPLYLMCTLLTVFRHRTPHLHPLPQRPVIRLHHPHHLLHPLETPSLGTHTPVSPLVRE